MAVHPPGDPVINDVHRERDHEQAAGGGTVPLERCGRARDGTQRPTRRPDHPVAAGEPLFYESKVKPEAASAQYQPCLTGQARSHIPMSAQSDRCTQTSVTYERR